MRSFTNDVLSLRRCHSEVKGNRHPSSPAWEVNIGRSALGCVIGWPGWKKQARFFNFRAKAGFAAKVEDDVPNAVVSNNPVSARAAFAAVVAKRIQHIIAQWTKAGLFFVCNAQPVAYFCAKFVSGECSASGPMGDGLPDFAGAFFAFRQQ